MRAEKQGLLGAALLMAAACQGDTIRLGDGRSSAPDTLPEFSEPTPIEGVSQADASDDDPSLSLDLKLLYFNSEREGGLGREDIWHTQRTSAAASWQPPEPAQELNSEQRETGIALSADGLLILFSSDREGGAGGLDIYLARRESRSAGFAAPARVSALCSEGDDLVSALSVDGATVYLARRSSEDDDYALFSARRVGDGFAAPVALATLDGRGPESDAFPVQRGLLFTRDEQLLLAPGSGQSLDAPLLLESLNSDSDDRDPWASQDLSYVVFSSDRSGTYRLYEAHRTNLPNE